MLRRVHVSRVREGEIPLEPSQARHARDVLRLADGTSVEVFDDAGAAATGTLVLGGITAPVVVRVDAGSVRAASGQQFRWTVAAAIPKGERADWMVEKLSELGVAAFIPITTGRGVVLAGGTNKRQRWLRLATESAKQSRRAGVMRIEEVTPLAEVVGRLSSVPANESAAAAGWYLSTAPEAQPIGGLLAAHIAAASGAPTVGTSLTLLIGPEGGWTDDEMMLMSDARLIPVRLTNTVLRVETAAIAVAAIVGSILLPRLSRQTA